MLALWAGLTRIAPWAFNALARNAHRRQGADPARLPERFGHRLAPTLPRPVWFHGASIGEIAQIRPVAEHVNRRGHAVLITTGTQTSADWVAQYMPFATHAFAPVDTPRAAQRFLDGWNPTAVCFAEGDLWPNVVAACKTQALPLALLNPRPSKTRARFKRAFRKMLDGFAFVSVKSSDLYDEFKTLGITKDALVRAPDLKQFGHNAAHAPFDGPDRFTVVAASTHSADEPPLADAFRVLRARERSALLIVVPRHPQRGPSVQSFFEDHGFHCALRSADAPITPDTQVYIADTTGELPTFMAMADVVFMGGSFGEQGGHNPFEAAAAERPILTGPKVANFQQAFQDLTESGAAVFCPTPTSLGAAFTRLLQPDHRAAMAAAARAFNAKGDDLVDFLAAFDAFIDGNL